MSFIKSKFLLILLLLSSLLGYLEWGEGRHMFLFQVQGEVLRKLFTDPVSVLHPLIVLPLAGQILLLAAMLTRRSGRGLALGALAGLGILYAVLLLVGLMSHNLRIILSTLPFLILAVVVLLHFRRPQTA